MNKIAPRLGHKGHIDLLPFIVEAIRPHWKEPPKDGCASVDDAVGPEARRAVISAIGGADLSTTLAQYVYACSLFNNGGHDDRDIEHAAAMVLMNVTEARLLRQPATSATDLECRLRYMAIARENGVWPDEEVIPSLERAKRDVYLITEASEETRAQELEKWGAVGEPEYHGYEP